MSARSVAQRGPQHELRRLVIRRASPLALLVAACSMSLAAPALAQPDADELLPPSPAPASTPPAPIGTDWQDLCRRSAQAFASDDLAQRETAFRQLERAVEESIARIDSASIAISATVNNIRRSGEALGPGSHDGVIAWTTLVPDCIQPLESMLSQNSSLCPEGRHRVERLLRRAFDRSPRSALGVRRGGGLAAAGQLDGRAIIADTYWPFDSQRVFRTGDVVVGMSGKPIRGWEDLVAVILSHDPGDRTTVDIIRAGERVREQLVMGAFVALPESGAPDRSRFNDAFALRLERSAAASEVPSQPAIAPDIRLAQWSSPLEEDASSVRSERAEPAGEGPRSVAATTAQSRARLTVNATPAPQDLLNLLAGIRSERASIDVMRARALAELPGLPPAQQASARAQLDRLIARDNELAQREDRIIMQIRALQPGRAP